jgi:hypothetical protein
MADHGIWVNVKDVGSGAWVDFWSFADSISRSDAKRLLVNLRRKIALAHERPNLRAFADGRVEKMKCIRCSQELAIALLGVGRSLLVATGSALLTKNMLRER